MKILALSIALTVGGAANAQMTPPAEPATTQAPATETQPTGEMPIPPSATVTQAPDAPTAPAPASQMALPAATPPPAGQAEYPRCSKTITDQCVQGSGGERDTKRKRRRS